MKSVRILQTVSILWLFVFALLIHGKAFGQDANPVQVTVLEDYVNQNGVVIIVAQIDGSTHVMGLGCNLEIASCGRPLAGEKGTGGLMKVAGEYGQTYFFRWSEGGGMYWLVGSK